MHCLVPDGLAVEDVVVAVVVHRQLVHIRWRLASDITIRLRIAFDHERGVGLRLLIGAIVFAIASNPVSLRIMNAAHFVEGVLLVWAAYEEGIGLRIALGRILIVRAIGLAGKLNIEFETFGGRCLVPEIA